MARMPSPRRPGWRAGCRRAASRPAGSADGDHARALAIRGGLRAQFASHNGVAPDPAARAGLREAVAGLPAAYVLDDDGALTPDPAVTGVPGALGLLVAIVHEAQLAGTWPRLKACPGHHCGWVFYDVSRQRGQHLVLDAGLRQPREGPRVPPPGARGRLATRVCPLCQPQVVLTDAPPREGEQPDQWAAARSGRGP